MQGLAAQLNECTSSFASCQFRDAIIYLTPSMLLAALINFLAKRYSVFLLFRLAGTICHEAAHFTVGFLTGAEPRSFSIIPRRSGTSWQLGSVMLTNIRWYNAAPAALAPMLIILIPALVAFWRTRNGLNFEALDIALAFVLAPQFLSCMPSIADWKIALHSWPYLAFAAAFWWLWHTVNR